jgi:hypothetical protein
MTDTVTNATHTTDQTAGTLVRGQLYVVSCYVKKVAGNNWCVLGFGTATQFFNLSTGTVGVSFVGCTEYQIADAGGGWYRISYLASYTSGTCRVYLASGDGAAGYAGGANQIAVGGYQAELAYPGQTTPSALITTGVAPLAVYEHSQNLGRYSEQFDNAAWDKNSGALTVSANAVAAPTGPSTADTLTWTNLGRSPWMLQSVTASTSPGSTYTFSCWIKSTGGASHNLTIGGWDNTNAWAQTTVAVTSAWQRFSATFTYAAASTSRSVGITQTTGVPVAGVDMWGAQLELASTPGTYVQTTSAIVDVGLPNPQNRWQNKLLQSETFDNASWTKSNSSIAANSTVGPYGLATADTLTLSGTTGQMYQLTVPSFLRKKEYTLSCYVKKGTNSFFGLNLQGNSDYYAAAVFNLDTGAVTETTALGTTGGTTITVTGTKMVALTGGWYRCEMTVLPALSAAETTGLQYVTVFLPPLASGNTWNSNGISTGETIGATAIIWGAQLEETNHAGPYVATTSAMYNPSGAPRSNVT